MTRPRGSRPILDLALLAAGVVVVSLGSYELLGGCASATPAPTVRPSASPAKPCRQVGTGSDPAALAALWRDGRGANLVLIGNAVLICGCEERSLAGDTERRQLGGGTEKRQLGGDTEKRQLGGDSEKRQLGGDTERRQLGGDRESRQLGGGTEARHLGGDTESRQLGGGTEARHLGGDTESRSLGGGVENRQLGGGVESRQLGGGVETRQLAGAVESFSCVEQAPCRGYRVSGTLPLRYYDGQKIVAAPDRCVQ